MSIYSTIPEHPCYCLGEVEIVIGIMPSGHGVAKSRIAGLYQGVGKAQIKLKEEWPWQYLLANPTSMM